jgi:hypothetical protein
MRRLWRNRPEVLSGEQLHCWRLLLLGRVPGPRRRLWHGYRVRDLRPWPLRGLRFGWTELLRLLVQRPAIGVLSHGDGRELRPVRRSGPALLRGHALLPSPRDLSEFNLHCVRRPRPAVLRRRHVRQQWLLLCRQLCRGRADVRDSIQQLRDVQPRRLRVRQDRRALLPNPSHCQQRGMHRFVNDLPVRQREHQLLPLRSLWRPIRAVLPELALQRRNADVHRRQQRPRLWAVRRKRVVAPRTKNWIQVSTN